MKEINYDAPENLDNAAYSDFIQNNDRSTEVELAYRILTDAGKDNPVHYLTLILKILKLKGSPILVEILDQKSVEEITQDYLEKTHKFSRNEAAAISEVYTMINMDSRFQYAGDGKWGLTEWNPPEVKRSRGGSAKDKASKKNSGVQSLDGALEEETSDRMVEDMKQVRKILEDISLR